MRERYEDKWIRRMDIGRLVVALIGLVVIVLHIFSPGLVDIDFMISNVFAVYVFLMGFKTLLLGKNSNLAWFYMFFAAMMFIVVNMIWFRFGE